MTKVVTTRKETTPNPTKEPAMNNFNQAHLADYISFNSRRLLANLFFENDGSMASWDHNEVMQWRSLSSLLLMPIWYELDQYARSYVEKRWATLGSECDFTVVNLMLVRDLVTESDFPMGLAEAQRMCRDGKLIHRYIDVSDDEQKSEIVLQVDTASVLLNRYGVVDPRLEHGACLRDDRPASERVPVNQCQCHDRGLAKAK